MTTETLTAHAQREENSKDVFGFWIYIMSDCILFSCLFATFIVLRHNTFGGPGMREITNLPYVLKETLFLLASSFTYGMAILSMYKNHQQRVIGWLIVTFLFGLSFVVMEVNEFIHLVIEGHGPNTSGAMSAFFTLVGTHGFHVSMGLFWMLILIIQTTIFKLNQTMRRRLTYLGLFWAFLDIVWIFVFTIVYLMGVA